MSTELVVEPVETPSPVVEPPSSVVELVETGFRQAQSPAVGFRQAQSPAVGFRQAQSPASPRGELALRIGGRGGRSFATHQFHQGALRVLRPHYLDESGQVCYVVVNPGGAYLGADLYVIDVEVEAGADLLLTTQSATKVYRTPGSFAEQRMSVRLGEEARLELLPDQLIAYREASYRQNSHITVHPTSSLVSAEVVTPGWSPEGAAFRYEELRLRSEVRVETAPGEQELLVLDNVLIRPNPGSPDDVTGMGFMEGFSHLGSLLVVDPRVDQALADDLHQLTAGHPAHSGISLTRTVAGTTGLMLRALSNSTGGLNRLLGECTALLRNRWYGQQPLNLRKY
ncbi:MULTISPECIES: urease accessory protein UreD [unclassified Pseudarthrobacter]|uniref:urease accessory protein UreD n=1 Tax=unclassified Pseudarthrobacter TaxID=2647000 RepID=UPI003CC656BC